MYPVLRAPMNSEQTRHERFIAYAVTLKERFHAGLLAELQPLHQWVVWRGELDEQVIKKRVPYNPRYHLAHASVKIPNSWGILDQALKALETGNYSGIGFMLTPPVVFIDLDHCYERTTETITEPQAAVVKEINSYIEVSPGKGLHILAYGRLPGKGIHTVIEMYGQDRFTTITTDHLHNTPTTIEHRQQAIEALYRRFAPAVPETRSLLKN
jgi:primase-polymerase (primpol)-like protein